MIITTTLRRKYLYLLNCVLTVTFWRQGPHSSFVNQPKAHSQLVSPTDLEKHADSQEAGWTLWGHHYSCLLPICAVLSGRMSTSPKLYLYSSREAEVFIPLVSELRDCSHGLPAWGKQERINQSALIFQNGWTGSQIIKLLWHLHSALALESLLGNSLTQLYSPFSRVLLCSIRRNITQWYITLKKGFKHHEY